MPIIEKTVRFAAITIAVLFVGMGLSGVFGVWLVERRATEIALQGFGLIETGVGVVNAGVAHVDNLIATCRGEMRQASETITTVGARTVANSPVLSALNERLETRLAPRIAHMQQALVPVRDAVAAIANAVKLVSSLPIMADRAPRLAALDDSFNRLEELAADTTQLRGTLRALMVAETGETPAETVFTLNGLTRRIESRLGEVHANVHEVQADIAALQVRLDTRKSRVLFVFKLLATVATLMLAWILYTQIVVVQHHRARVRQPSAK